MSLKTIDPTKTKAWKKLQAHFKEIQKDQMRSWFEEDPERAQRFSIQWYDLYLDYSKNRITDTTMQLLVELAEEMGLANAIERYFTGDLINETENRAVLHTALRGKETDTILVDGKNIVPDIYETLQKMRTFSHNVIFGKRRGFTKSQFTDVVNIGIGGSDLGPVMVTEALKYYRNHLNVHFVSNVDGDHVQEVIKGLNPETTLVIIVSKSFTTQETLANATTVRHWFLKKLPQEAIAHHFVAVSTNLAMIQEFGIADDLIFPMWDWVGGRFSLWSAVGLSISLAIGHDNFEKLLDGAHMLDIHFREAPYAENIPVVLALLSIWYNNFFEAESEAIIPYTQYLHRLPAYLQQAIMESNGKRIDRSGNTVGHQTGTIIWGEPGTNSQHAFFQLIHQGTKLIPADFIGFKESLYGNKDHHDKLMANFFAQTEALLNGKDEQQVRAELSRTKRPNKEIDKLVPYKIFEGNNPTNTFLFQKLTPKALGVLIATYEHKIFVQGVLWNIFSYDQWGVELGKQLATTVLKDLGRPRMAPHDSSTRDLLKHYKASHL